jgi:hypothetical protein
MIIMVQKRNWALNLILQTLLTTLKPPQTPMINLSDPALWPKIYDRKMINHLILHGPKKVQLMHYPQDENDGHHFSDCHYLSKLANNEFIPHQWLMQWFPNGVSGGTTRCVAKLKKNI